MHFRGFKLTKPYLIWFYLMLSGLMTSGLIWMFSHYYLQNLDNWYESALLINTYSMRIHGASMFLFLVILGSLIPVHIYRALKSKLNKIYGLLVLSALAILIFTGFWLYYIPIESVREITSIIHQIAGVFLPLGIWWHIIMGRKMLKSAEKKSID